MNPFEGHDGAARLRDALKDQKVLGGDSDAIEAVAGCLEILRVEKNEKVLSQGDSGKDVYFLLQGMGLQILVDGRPVAAREAGTIVGEMAAIEPAGTRSATVRATGPTILGKLPGAEFSRIAGAHPAILYRGIARLVADRLRERSKFIRPRGATPCLFVGSSVEGVSVAQGLQEALDHDIEAVVWTDSVFRPGATAIENLSAALDKYDFAVLIATPDDEITTTKGGAEVSMRDNVLFEYGLFIGALGRERVFLLKPRGVVLHMASDLAGVVSLEYDAAKTNLASSLGPACNKLRRVIEQHGPR